MKKFLVMKVNSGRRRRVVKGRSLKGVKRRLGLAYLVQEYKGNETQAGQ
jgi:hypothetical protein